MELSWIARLHTRLLRKSEKISFCGFPKSTTSKLDGIFSHTISLVQIAQNEVQRGLRFSLFTAWNEMGKVLSFHFRLEATHVVGLNDECLEIEPLPASNDITWWLSSFEKRLKNSLIKELKECIAARIKISEFCMSIFVGCSVACVQIFKNGVYIGSCGVRKFPNLLESFDCFENKHTLIKHFNATFFQTLCWYPKLLMSCATQNGNSLAQSLHFSSTGEFTNSLKLRLYQQELREHKACSSRHSDFDFSNHRSIIATRYIGGSHVNKKVNIFAKN